MSDQLQPEGHVRHVRDFAAESVPFEEVKSIYRAGLPEMYGSFQSNSTVYDASLDREVVEKKEQAQREEQARLLAQKSRQAQQKGLSLRRKW